jgi:protein-tyrosine phosphatase
MNFIIDRLAIGELLDGESNPPVAAILNLSEFEYQTPLIYKHIYFPDFEYLKDLALIGQCTEFIREQIMQRHRVLVHCFAGISRSTMICMAYLYECGMSFEEALTFIREKHPVANPHETLVHSLYDWYGCLYCHAGF